MQVNREWISISDMMAGLMMVFLFIAVLFMSQIQEKNREIQVIAEGYKDIRQQLHDDLNREFKDDLEYWGAEILADNTVLFKSPDILFEVDSAIIKPRFKEVLNDFFPRYLMLLTNKTYKSEIDEVRVEGHTSSRWKIPAQSYIGNINLSQKRARAVLVYSYTIAEKHDHKKWLEKVFRANGMAFAKRKLSNSGTEDYVASRRVEFRVVTKAEEKIYEILDKLQ